MMAARFGAPTYLVLVHAFSERRNLRHAGTLRLVSLAAVSSTAIVVRGSGGLRILSGSGGRATSKHAADGMSDRRADCYATGTCCQFPPSRVAVARRPRHSRGSARHLAEEARALGCLLLRPGRGFLDLLAGSGAWVGSSGSRARLLRRRRGARRRGHGPGGSSSSSTTRHCGGCVRGR
jgi:hypothetical protein